MTRAARAGSGSRAHPEFNVARRPGRPWRIFFLP